MRKVGAGEAPQGGLWVGVGEGEGEDGICNDEENVCHDASESFI